MILRIMTVNRELEASGSQKMRGEVILLAFLFALFSIHCNESTQTADSSQQAQDFQNHAGTDTGFGHGKDPGMGLAKGLHTPNRKELRNYSDWVPIVQ